jgi:hypothetical protein
VVWDGMSAVVVEEEEEEEDKEKSAGSVFCWTHD